VFSFILVGLRARTFAKAGRGGEGGGGRNLMTDFRRAGSVLQTLRTRGNASRMKGRARARVCNWSPVTKRVALNETKEKGRKGKRTGLMEINEKKGKEEKKKRISPRSPSLSVGCLYSMEINNRNCERRIPRSNSPIEFAN